MALSSLTALPTSCSCSASVDRLWPASTTDACTSRPPATTRTRSSAALAETEEADIEEGDGQLLDKGLPALFKKGGAGDIAVYLMLMFNEKKDPDPDALALLAGLLSIQLEDSSDEEDEPVSPLRNLSLLVIPGSFAERLLVITGRRAGAGAGTG